VSNPISDVITGALFQEMRMSILSNNISNINTAGYKEDRMTFHLNTGDGENDDISANALTAANPPGPAPGNPMESYTNFSLGQIQQTGNHLDLAIEGDGFFSVQTPEGTQYTRKGNFTLDDTGKIVTPEGYALLGNGGEIVMDGGRIEIDSEGNVKDDGGLVGTLKIVDFPEPIQLQKAGNSFFIPANPEIQGEPVECPQVMQGYLERSNVSAVKSMTEMIQVLRGYESYQKIIQSLDEATTKAVNEVGRLK